MGSVPLSRPGQSKWHPLVAVAVAAVNRHRLVVVLSGPGPSGWKHLWGRILWSLSESNGRYFQQNICPVDEDMVLGYPLISAH